ncbi:MAG: hypothetical protein WA060_02165 [Minisyncoccia bacterium]
MEKIKLFIGSEKGNDILIVIIIILVGLGSFELGRLSKESSKEGIQIEYQGQLQDISQSANVISTKSTSSFKTPESSFSGKTFFASNRGSKYYPISCSAGKTIKPENRVWFTTGEEAEQAGYVLSGSCQ